MAFVFQSVCVQVHTEHLWCRPIGTKRFWNRSIGRSINNYFVERNSLNVLSVNVSFSVLHRFERPSTISSPWSIPTLHYYVAILSFSSDWYTSSLLTSYTISMLSLPTFRLTTELNIWKMQVAISLLRNWKMDSPYIRFSQMKLNPSRLWCNNVVALVHFIFDCILLHSSSLIKTKTKNILYEKKTYQQIITRICYSLDVRWITILSLSLNHTKQHTVDFIDTRYQRFPKWNQIKNKPKKCM